MTKRLTIGMIGLDSSRSVSFAELLGSRRPIGLSFKADLAMACVGPVSQSERDAERVLAHAQVLREQWGVSILEQPEAVAGACDVLLLLSADARDRAWCFDRVVDAGKPMYLEKMLAYTADAAREMVNRAARAGGRAFSASSVRYAPGWRKFVQALRADHDLRAIELTGPTPAHETLPLPMWYGVHLADLAIDALGPGWERIDRTVTDDGETTRVSWPDGRSATLHGYRNGPTRYTAAVKPGESSPHDLGYDPRRCNTGLLNAIHDHLTADTHDPSDFERMIKVVRLVEAMAGCDAVVCGEKD